MSNTPVDTTHAQKMFPLGYIALNDHITKGNEKYGRTHTTPLEPEYANLEYSLAKLHRHLLSLSTGTVIDPESGSHQAASIAWHALNILNSYEDQYTNVQDALYGRDEVYNER